MSGKTKTFLLGGLGLLVIGLSAFWLRHADIAVLEPQGPIGQKEKNLIVTAFLLSMLVVIPVYAMLIGFAVRYREGNKKAKYSPGFDHSRWMEGAWWAVPLAIISILAVMTWRASRDLDPFKSLGSSTPPMTIQVVSLQWKWLFIYPEQDIASVNYLQLPVNTPVDFNITSDAPMNSFWIPQLGGQIYAMSGMSTHLHLLAQQTGEYTGVSANISGDGFAGMHFKVRSSSDADFKNWVSSIHGSAKQLDAQTYQELSKPSLNNPVSYYGSAEPGMYSSIVNKYLAPVYFRPAVGVR
jgi:cytochrome o ubiquinol oxidase subunit II